MFIGYVSLTLSLISHSSSICQYNKKDKTEIIFMYGCDLMKYFTSRGFWDQLRTTELFTNCRLSWSVLGLPSGQWPFFSMYILILPSKDDSDNWYRPINYSLRKLYMLRNKILVMWFKIWDATILIYILNIIFYHVYWYLLKLNSKPTVLKLLK